MSLTPDPTRCPYCSGSHASKCPLVKALEYHRDGKLKRVEFFAPSDYRSITSAGSISGIPASPYLKPDGRIG